MMYIVRYLEILYIKLLTSYSFRSMTLLAKKDVKLDIEGTEDVTSAPS